MTRRRAGNFVLRGWLIGCLAWSATGCSLLYPFDLPDATDATVEADADDGEAETGPVCGDGVVTAPEVCDTALAPESCTTACGSRGSWSCAADCRTRDCEAPVDESCNGADDDCDGSTDEGYACAAGLPVACTSPCGVPGTTTCTVTCEMPPPWECRTDAELCNGCDDNRDGRTDEGCACATEWTVEQPLAPGPGSMQYLSIAPDGTGAAVGVTGRNLRFDGTRWSLAESSVSLALRGVRALSADFAVAAGQNGTVARWDGASWRLDVEASAISTAALFAVGGTAEDDLWVVGNGGTALRRDASGWRMVPTGTTRHLYAVWASGPSNAYVAGTGGVVLRWNGTAWSSISPPWLTVELEAVWARTAASPVYVGGTDGTIARYNPSGGTWEDMTSGTGTLETIYGIWGADDDDVWAVGGFTGGTVLHFDGTTWSEDTTVPSIDPQGYLAVGGTASDNVFVLARNGGILHWDGRSWRPMEDVATISLVSVWGSSPQDVHAMGTATDRAGTTSTAILRYDGTDWAFPESFWRPGTAGRGGWSGSPSALYIVNGTSSVEVYDGSSWSTRTPPFVGIELLGVGGLAAGDVFLSGGQTSGEFFPVLYQLTASGEWMPLVVRPELPGEDLLAVHALSANDVLAVGTGGTIVRRAPGEDFMDQMASGTTETLRGVWMASATEAFAVGDNGTLLHWDGTAWTSMTSPADPWNGLRLNAVWGSSATNVFVVGEFSTLLRYDGSSWSPVPVEVLSDLTGIWGSSANNVFAIADDRSGKILHRCGASW
ncbi:MAG: hypothetical protein GYA57_19360 [Myxococcales bacterium]|nr:hypothetical protein [Myxococcales bacterium]